MATFAQYEELVKQGKIDPNTPWSKTDVSDDVGNSLIDWASNSEGLKKTAKAYNSVSDIVGDFFNPTTTAGLKRNEEKNKNEAWLANAKENAQVQWRSTDSSTKKIDGSTTSRVGTAIQTVMGDYSPTLNNAISGVGESLKQGGHDTIGQSLLDFGKNNTSYWDDTRLDAKADFANWKKDNPKKLDVAGGVVEISPYIAGAIVTGGSSAPTMGGRLLGNAALGAAGDTVVGAIQYGDEPGAGKKIVDNALLGAAGNTVLQPVLEGIGKAGKAVLGKTKQKIKPDSKIKTNTENMPMEDTQSTTITSPADDISIAKEINKKITPTEAIAKEVEKLDTFTPTPKIQNIINTAKQNNNTKGISNRAISIESGGNYNAVNKKSGAFGKYQFMPSTLKEYANKAGLTIDQAKTPQGQEAIYKIFSADQNKGLIKKGIEPNEFNTYMAHQQGVSGWDRILKGNIDSTLTKNMLSNTPAKARLTGNVRTDFLNFWSKKFKDTSTIDTPTPHIADDVVDTVDDTMAPQTPQAKSALDDLTEIVKKTDEATQTPKVKSALDELENTIAKADESMDAKVAKTKEAIDDIPQTPSAKLYNDIKTARGDAEARANMELLQARAKAAGEDLDTFIGNNPVDINPNIVDDIAPPYSHIDKIGKGYDQMTFDELKSHPRYQELVDMRRDVSSTQANKVTNESKASGYYDDTGTYVPSRIKLNDTNRNFAGDFELTKADIRAIESGKLTPQIHSKLANDLGRLDYDPNWRSVAQRSADGKIKKGMIEFGIKTDNEIKAVITLFRDADVTTLPHELAHFFRRTMSAEENKVAREAFEVKGETWDKAAEERFANGFVKYLSYGEAPHPLVAGVFDKFKNWIKDVWVQVNRFNTTPNGTKITDLGMAHQLTPQQKQFYDALLGDRDAAQKLFGEADVTPPASTVIPAKAGTHEADELFQAINKETKEVDIEAFNKFAEPLPKSDNILEFVKDFAMPIKTPIGEFKVDTDYMLNKAMERDGGLRINQIGYIKPTLERPAYIIEVEGKFHFIKPFIDETDKVRKFLSVISDRDGNVNMVTSTILRDKDIRRIVKNGNIIEDFVSKVEDGTHTSDGMSVKEPELKSDTHDTTIPPKDLKADKLFKHTDKSGERIGRGYDGYSTSNNALIAREEGKFPKAEAAKMLGISPTKIEQILDIAEWHHTSKYYNKTPFYDVRPYYYLKNNDTSSFNKYLEDIDGLDNADYYKDVFHNLVSKKQKKIRPKDLVEYDGGLYTIKYDTDFDGKKLGGITLYKWMTMGGQKQLVPWSDALKDVNRLKEIVSKNPKLLDEIPELNDYISKGTFDEGNPNILYQAWGSSDKDIDKLLGIPQELTSFGRNFAQFKGNPKKAIAHLMKVKNGQVRGALYHNEIGEIDIVWGKVIDPKEHTGYGLAHIIDKHGEDIARRLDDIIMGGKVVEKKGNRVVLKNDDDLGIVSLEWNKKDKKWVISAYEPEKQISTDASTVAGKSDNLSPEADTTIPPKDLKTDKTDTLNQEQTIENDIHTVAPKATWWLPKILNTIKQSDGWATVSKHRLNSVVGYESLKEQTFRDIQTQLTNIEELHHGLKEFSEETRVALHRYMTGQKVELHPELKLLADSFRGQINDMGQELVDSGVLAKETFDDWKSVYLHRSYAKHLNKESAKRAFKEGGTLDTVYERGKSLRFKADEIPEIKEDLYANGYKADDIDNANTIDELIALANTRGIAEGGTKITKLPNGKIKLRRDYTFDERLAMGEVEDIAYTLPQTMASLQVMVNNAKFLDSLPNSVIANAKEFTPEVLDSSGFKLASGKKYGALNGKWVHKDVLRDINKFQRGFFGEDNGFAKIGAKLLTYFKKTHTVYNPGTHLNNLMANIPMSYMGGLDPIEMVRIFDIGIRTATKINRVTELKGKLSVRPNDTKLKAELASLESPNVKLWYTLQSKGLFGRSGLNDTLGKYYKSSTIEPKEQSKLVNGLKWIDEKASTLYASEDDIYRFALAKHYVEKNKMSIDDAITKVNQNLPDYTKTMPPFQDFLRRTGIVPFMSWTYHSAPILVRQVKEHKIKAAVAFALMTTPYMMFDINPFSKKDTPDMYAFKRIPISKNGNKVQTLKIDKWNPHGDLLGWLPFTNKENVLVPENLKQMFTGSPYATLLGWAINHDFYYNRKISYADNAIDRNLDVNEYLAQGFLTPDIIDNLYDYVDSRVRAKKDRAKDKVVDPRTKGEAQLKMFGINLKTYNKDKLREEKENENVKKDEPEIKMSLFDFI